MDGAPSLASGEGVRQGGLRGRSQISQKVSTTKQMEGGRNVGFFTHREEDHTGISFWCIGLPLKEQKRERKSTSKKKNVSSQRRNQDVR